MRVPLQKVKIKNALQKMQSVWQGRRDSGEALRSESGAASNPAETVACSVKKVKIKKRSAENTKRLAGETRLEHATGGFGDRCSTN